MDRELSDSVTRIYHMEELVKAGWEGILPIQKGKPKLLKNFSVNLVELIQVANYQNV